MLKYIKRFDFLRYGIVGAFTVVLDFTLLAIFFSLLNININISITLAYFLASICNFFMHKYFTFKSKSKIFKELKKFIFIVLVTYTATIIIVNYLILQNFNIYESKIIALIFSYLVVYIISKFYIYK
ncbi:MAG: hypothetical protein GQ570_01545 [Helicobacteraceae bacterium]|nr:hypothetical protein [Helicobacteraceae bacterium]